ncbi:MAG: amidohydrolase family protein [Bacteroidales bacterium]|jgi:cytosine/adenosine deaminase-related metal-dependent hydrolase|nr:amidohydrolase family protein [Bacteroidales bacterium]
MRKIRAHYIFDGFRFRKNAQLVVSDDGVVQDIYSVPEPIEEEAGVEFYAGIISPGFVNAHCHLELSNLQTHIPQKTGLPDFVSSVARLKKEIPFSEDACKETDELMWNNGIVAVGDISNFSDTFALKETSPIQYHTFIELFDLHEDSRAEYERGKKLFKSYLQRKHVSLSPHAPYSCSRKLCAKIEAHAVDYEYPVTIHNQEHESENEMFSKHSGQLFQVFQKELTHPILHTTYPSSLRFSAGAFEQVRHMLFVHNVYMSEYDIRFLLEERGAQHFTCVVCLCSNMYIHDELPPLPLFLKYSVQWAIGTDSLASNTDVSMIREMLSLQQAFPEVSLNQLLHAATYRGAYALNLQSRFGQFSKGKKPGVILIEQLDLQNMRLTPETKVRMI